MRRLALFAMTGAALGVAVVLTSCDRFANQPKLRGFVVPYGEELAYPLHDWTAVITTCGRICYQRRKINVSQCLRDRRWA